MYIKDNVQNRPTIFLTWRCWPVPVRFLLNKPCNAIFYKSIVIVVNHPIRFFSRRPIYYQSWWFHANVNAKPENLTLIPHACIIQYPQPTHFFVCNWLSLNFKQTSKCILYTILTFFTLWGCPMSSPPIVHKEPSLSNKLKRIVHPQTICLFFFLSL